MTERAVIYTAGNIIQAADLNQNEDNILAVAKNVGNEQILGGITYDKLADNSGITWSHLNLLPFTSGADLGTPAGFKVPDTLTAIDQFRPEIKPNWEAYLLAITVRAIEHDVLASEDFEIEFRRNGVDVIGAAVNVEDADGTVYILARQDPTVNELTTIANGDYIEVFIGKLGGANAEPRGLSCDFALKHVLIE